MENNNIDNHEHAKEKGFDGYLDPTDIQRWLRNKGVMSKVCLTGCGSFASITIFQIFLVIKKRGLSRPLSTASRVFYGQLYPSPSLQGLHISSSSRQAYHLQTYSR